MAEILKAKEPGRNTPRGGVDNVDNVPGNFQVISLTLQNSKGGSAKDIRNLIDSFSITEELFSPVVTFTATIRDTERFFETFPIVGQERLVVNIKKTDDNTNIRHIFYVKEYPNFERTLDFPSVQIYTIVAISQFAYTSNLFTICRAIKGNVVDNIKKIFTDDLNLNNVVSESSGDTKCKSEFEGVITIQNPLKAAEWLRSRAFDADGSPFFMYSKISSKQSSSIYLHSWKYISKTDIYKRYYYRQFIKGEPGSEDVYIQEMSRILTMKSNLKLDRLGLAKQGAYASRLNVTDYAAKAFYTRDYDSTATDGVISSSSNANTGWKSLYYKVSTPKGKKTKQLHELPTASISAIQINTAKTDGSKGNSTTAALLENALFAKSFLANMTEANHEISVYGDPQLNPGVKIHLTIPQNIRDATTATVDESMSGEYIITVSSHTFIDGIYINRLKLVKNTLAVGKTSSGITTSSSQGKLSETLLERIF
jgi:hypothetical protein